MDLDAFSLARRPRWTRLDALTKARRLTGAEADELVRLYQATATDLSMIRSAAPDPSLVSHLSQLLGRSRVAIAGAHEPAWSDVARFVVVTLPAALYRLRWWTVGVTAASALLAVVAGLYLAASPDVLAHFMSPSEQTRYVDSAFSQYYDPGPGFAAMVWTNNAWITAQCIGLGISGVWPALVMVQNSLNVGAAGAVMGTHGRLDVFFQLIAPHGLLELTSVFVGGAAGLALFWTWIDPGDRPRGRALAQEGRALFTVAIGLVGTLAVSGLIEGFVTGSGLPWAVKIATGVLAVAGFWTYTLVLGRRAVADGATGDLDADQAGYVLPIAG